MRRATGGIVALATLAAGCREAPVCDTCDTVVIAATGEPTTLVPPLITQSVGRDVTDQVFETLAVLAPGGSPNDPAAFRPALAERWVAMDSTTWRFILRSGAQWHDGRPVTPDDVVFSFDAFVDTTLGAPASVLVGRVTVAAEGDSAVLVRFAAPAAEMLYDATHHVRVMPRHVWNELPRAQWAADTTLARLVGSGPFRVVTWSRGQSLVLERAVAGRPRLKQGEIRRLVWRFAGDQDAAVNLVLAHQADLIETVVSPGAREQIAKDSTLREIPYAAAVYGYVGLRHASADGTPHPLLSQRAIRRALTLAVDRQTLVRAVVGPEAVVPPGPIARAVWIWDDSIATLPYDTAAANALLDSLGAVRGPDQIRWLSGRPLTVDILVPSTSTVRRNLAQGLQEMWRLIGIAATVTAVDFPVFQQRLSAGKFDAMIGAWLADPSPRDLADHWTRAGWGVLNYGRYANPAFDSLFKLASGTVETAAARARWKAALDLLNADAPAVFLYTPRNVAVASSRLGGVEINPFSWLSEVASWRVIGPR